MEAPQYYNMGGYFGAGVPATFNDYSPEKNQKLAGDPSHFIVDDLLDFPNDDDAIMTDGFFDNIAKNCAASTADSPAFTSNGDSCNSSSTSAGGPNPAAYQSFADSHFSSELCVPYDDLAELEWLSNFVDDSFSADQTYQPNHLQMLTASKSHTTESSSSDAGHLGRNMNHAMFQPDTPLPGKARSKRSRANPANWTTRLLQLAAPSGKAASKKQPQQQQEEDPTKLNSSGPGSGPGSVATMRRCLHCGSEKTPQWRTGPMGPKTLCNACGVRYKSGRLVPEYRPAASPTFVPAKHSNSHRKVLELRRQRELHATQQEQYLNQSSFFGVSNGGHELMVHHHHGGPSFRHMI